MGRILSIEALADRVRQERASGKSIALANGHFDLLHVGHLHYLQGAAEQADVLVVAVNDDASVRRLKGPGRPIVPARERAELLAALGPVDYVTVFSGDSPTALIDTLQPEVHCKGTDYGSPQNVPEFEAVRRYGGRTVLVGDPKEHATRDLIARVQALPKER